ncbi:MAG: phospho-sugar mutase [Myxococcota bacterium]
MSVELRQTAREWMSSDPDPVTRARVQAWLDSDDLDSLKEAFGARLQFGTAGLRGPIGPGPGAMNRALVRRVAAGLAQYLLDTVGDACQSGVVIGYDARHGSLEFAQDTASVLADRGIPSRIFDEVVPTPRLAHAIVETQGCAGVMVTASHNPPGDNGYKVYWADGAQIVPPHDVGISAAIDGLTGFDPREVGDYAAHCASGRIGPVPASVTEDYFRRVQGLRVHRGSSLRIVYTAMHGVGTESVVRALNEAGYDDVHLVAEQAEPDGDFPTVAFPNPEEPGALDLSYAVASRVQADLIVANDPDADRLAVAVPDGSGGWRQFTGNQVGCLLADDLLTHGESDGRTRLVATTVVSSRLLSRIADAHGAAYTETLTGFKWIAHAALKHEAVGGRFVLGYEEALGYSAGDVARDKDGVSAVLLFADLAAWCKSKGRSMVEHLTALYRRYGVHSSVQRSIKLPGAEGRAQIDAAMHRLRSNPLTELDGLRVVRFVDILARTITDPVTGAVRPYELPPSNVLAWTLEDGSQVLARPSGTEPKIKFYGEVREILADSDTLQDGERRAIGRVNSLVSRLVNAADLA